MFDRKAYMKIYNKKYRSENKEKIKEYLFNYKIENKEELKKKRRIYLNKPEARKKRLSNLAEGKLIKRYGISRHDYNLLLVKQNYSCLICHEIHSTRKKLNVDHNHSDRSVRGLLCGNCNRGLGLFKDNKKNLLKAVNYLKKHE